METEPITVLIMLMGSYNGHTLKLVGSRNDSTEIKLIIFGMPRLILEAEKNTYS